MVWPLHVAPVFVEQFSLSEEVGEDLRDVMPERLLTDAKRNVIVCKAGIIARAPIFGKHGRHELPGAVGRPLRIGGEGDAAEGAIGRCIRIALSRITDDGLISRIAVLEGVVADLHVAFDEHHMHYFRCF